MNALTIIGLAYTIIGLAFVATSPTWADMRNGMTASTALFAFTVTFLMWPVIAAYATVTRLGSLAEDIYLHMFDKSGKADT